MCLTSLTELGQEVEMAMDRRAQEVFLAPPELLRGLAIVPLAVMLALPATAQTGADSRLKPLTPSASQPSPSQNVILPAPIT